MTIAEILRAGKARLLEHGWCQGDEDAFTYQRGFCAATAIPVYFTSTFSDITSAFNLFLKVNGIQGTIGDWNDAPERALEDVLVAYDKAIAAAEAQ